MIRRILIYEPLRGGHVDDYLIAFANAFHRLDFDVTVATSSDYVLKHITGRFKTLRVFEEFTNVAPGANRARANARVVAAWLKLSIVYWKENCDFVFIPSLDRFTSPLIAASLAASIQGYSWTGMHMHTFHRKEKLSAMRKVLVKLAFTNAKSLITLDEFRVEPMRRDVGCPVFPLEEILPEPDPSDFVSNDVISLLGRMTRRPAITVLGAISKRKNIDNLVSALASLPPDKRPMVIMAGKSQVVGDDTSLSSDIIKTLENDLCILPRYVNSHEFIKLAAFSCALFNCTLDYPYSSNVAAHGFALNIPILGPSFGVVADRIEKSSFGWRCLESNVDAIAGVLKQVATMPPATSALAVKRLAVFREYSDSVSSSVATTVSAVSECFPTSKVI